MDVRSTDQSYEDEGATGVIYGPSGYGKTVMLSTLPSPFIMVCEPDGVKSIKGMGRTVSYVEPYSFKEMKEAIALFRRGNEKALKEDGKLRWESFCVDSITGAEDRLIIEAVQKGGPLTRDHAAESLSQQGWGQLGDRHRIIRVQALDLRRLGCHVFFTALPKEVPRPGDDNAKMMVPAISGQSGQRTPALFSLVLRMDLGKQRGETIRKVITQASPVGFAKDRYHRLAHTEIADFRIILAKCGFNVGSTPADEMEAEAKAKGAAKDAPTGNGGK